MDHLEVDFKCQIILVLIEVLFHGCVFLFSKIIFFVSWNLSEVVITVLEMKLLSIFQLLSFLKRKMIFGYNRRNFIRRTLTLFLRISIVVTFNFKKNTNFSSLSLEQSWVHRRFYGNNLIICLFFSLHLY